MHNNTMRLSKWRTDDGLTVDILESIGLPILQHAPYSPDLAPNDFYLYGELKRELKGI